MRPYSEDLRKRILWDVDLGISIQAISEKYRVTPQFVRKLRRRRDETGQIGPLKTRPGPRPKLVDFLQKLVEWVQADPDLTLEKLCQKLPFRVSQVTMWRTLRQLGFTLKKSSARGGTAARRRPRAASSLALLATAD
jgi:transposase